MKRITALILVLVFVVAIVAVGCDGGNGDADATATPAGSATVGSGGGIAFIGKSPQEAATDVYLLDADSEDIQQLTDTDDAEWWPVWSRDRQRLGYVTIPLPQTGAEGTPIPVDAAQRQLVVANADGSDPQRMGSSVLLQTYSGGFSWSPDGGQIVYMASDPAEEASTSRLRLVNVADGSEVALPEERLGYLPAWSPGGKQIVFGAFVGDPDESGNRESELLLMNSDGSNVRQLTDRPGPDVDPAWSPDGSRIAWWGQDPPAEGSQTQPNVLYMVDVQSGEVTELGEGADPVWSPDGQQIAFILQQQPEAGTFQTGANADIWVMDIETGARNPLAQDPSADLWPAWSPDGQRLAFVSERDNSSGEIYLMSADGSDVRRLTDNDLSEAMLAWTFS
jgi:Tol biopolymer transport system component